MRVEPVSDLAQSLGVPVRTSDGLGLYCAVYSPYRRLLHTAQDGGRPSAIALHYDGFCEAVTHIAARAIESARDMHVTSLWRLEDVMQREDIGHVIDITGVLAKDPGIDQKELRGWRLGLMDELVSFSENRDVYGHLLTVTSLPQIITVTECDIMSELMHLTAIHSRAA